uniref:Uncharacterized protein n=1 Tax=Pavo cristatus TaxID=9049 RepID=A0A8C9ETX2_PAVCR
MPFFSWAPLVFVPLSKNTDTKEMEKLTRLEALLLTAVLENCVDQLAILGYIMPVSHEGKTDTSRVSREQCLGSSLTCLPRTLLPPRCGCESSAAPAAGTHRRSRSRERWELFSFTQTEVDRPPRGTLSFSLQTQRQYTSDVITATMKKMEDSGTFDSLVEANGREKAKKSNLNDILIREEEGKKEIKSLQKQLQDVKKETEIELQNRDNVILYLKNELQEMEARAAMEHRYMKKSTDLQVHQAQKKCSNAENRLTKEIEVSHSPQPLLKSVSS